MTVSRLIGHASAVVTLGIYSHPAKAIEAAMIPIPDGNSGGNLNLSHQIDTAKCLIYKSGDVAERLKAAVC